MLVNHVELHDAGTRWANACSLTIVAMLFGGMAATAAAPASDAVGSSATGPIAPSPAVAPAAHSQADALAVQYAMTRLRLAELDLERAVEANARSPKSIGEREIQRLENHVELTRRQVDIVCAHPRTAARQATIAAIEAARENALGDLRAALAVNERQPGTVSDVNIKRLETKAELAGIRLQICQSPDSELSLLDEMQWTIDQLTDEVIDLRHTVDARAVTDTPK